jgi:hypothetical protein
MDRRGRDDLQLERREVGIRIFLEPLPVRLANFSCISIQGA